MTTEQKVARLLLAHLIFQAGNLDISEFAAAEEDCNELINETIGEEEYSGPIVKDLIGKYAEDLADRLIAKASV